MACIVFCLVTAVVMKCRFFFLIWYMCRNCGDWSLHFNGRKSLFWIGRWLSLNYGEIKLRQVIMVFFSTNKHSIQSVLFLLEKKYSPPFRTHHSYQNVSRVASLYYIHFLNFVYSTPCIVSLCVGKNLMNNSDRAPSFLQSIKIYFLWQRASWGLCRHGKYMIKCVGLTGEGSTKHTANELA